MKFVEEQREAVEMQKSIVPFMVVQDKASTFTNEIVVKAQRDAIEIGTASTHYLRIVGHFIFAYFWARMARLALDKADTGDRFYRSKLATKRFYFAKLLSEVDYHLAGSITTLRHGPVPQR